MIDRAAHLGVGDAVDERVGSRVGAVVGVSVRAGVGVEVGAGEGVDVSSSLGVEVGAGVGVSVGEAAKGDVGAGVGMSVGAEGVSVGEGVGIDVCIGVGMSVRTGKLQAHAIQSTQPCSASAVPKAHHSARMTWPNPSLMVERSGIPWHGRAGWSRARRHRAASIGHSVNTAGLSSCRSKSPSQRMMHAMPQSTR